MYIGIDVGADRLHCVALDERLRVREARLFTAGELESLVDAARGAEIVMVDAPAQASTSPHSDDPELSAKFRTARCAEIALGREHGSWVPFVTPATPPPSGWMATGLAVFAALEEAGVPTLEVFPYAGYRALSGTRALPKKTTAIGLRARIELLTKAGVRAQALPMWSHDGIDALLAALIAADYAGGRARRVTCGHDESAIWLPAAR